MTEADKKRLIQNGFDAYHWGRPFDLEFRRGRYTETERALCRVGWDKAERHHTRLQQEAENEAAEASRERDEFERLNNAVENLKKEILTLFGDKFATPLLLYIAAVLEKRDYDKERK